MNISIYQFHINIIYIIVINVVILLLFAIYMIFIGFFNQVIMIFCCVDHGNEEVNAIFIEAMITCAKCMCWLIEQVLMKGGIRCNCLMTSGVMRLSIVIVICGILMCRFPVICCLCSVSIHIVTLSYLMIHQIISLTLTVLSIYLFHTINLDFSFFISLTPILFDYSVYFFNNFTVPMLIFNFSMIKFLFIVFIFSFYITIYHF